MSCIIFGYRRFYAIICKITHFFYPERKNPPLFAHSALHKAKSVPCSARGRARGYILSEAWLLHHY